jgi:hypothetical protein
MAAMCGWPFVGEAVTTIGYERSRSFDALLVLLHDRSDTGRSQHAAQTEATRPDALDKRSTSSSPAIICRWVSGLSPLAIPQLAAVAAQK